MGTMTRREATCLLGAEVASLAAARAGFGLPHEPDAAQAAQSVAAPPLAPGEPLSAGRQALIETFRQQSEGLDAKYEARTHRSSFAMPYRLFRPQATGKLPLVLYLHGSGGLGGDNLKQLSFGNVYATRVWLLPENQKTFPCYVIAPQTDRGWAKYDLTQEAEGPAKVAPGVGDGSRLALEIVDAMCHEFPIDVRRIYVNGQSMGGAGVWNVLAARPGFFAAAIACCASQSTEDGKESVETPLWAFHGDADQTVPVTLTRTRIATRRKAGGHPLYTEYTGVDHNCWQWAYTEPDLVKWMFAQRRA
jgi:predicted peptidase